MTVTQKWREWIEEFDFTSRYEEDSHYHESDMEAAYKAGWEARAKWEAKITIDVLHLDEHGLADEELERKDFEYLNG